MPLRLTLLETLLSRLNILPTPLIDTPLAPGIAKVLVTSCELGLFDALDKQELIPEKLAEKLQCDPHGLQLLLQILASSGYLRFHKGKYCNARVARRWLVSSSPVCIAPYIIHSPDIVAIWDHLPAVVRTNQPAMKMPYEEDSPAMLQALARHYAGLAALANALSPEMTLRVRFPTGSTQLLDVGGSHAAYSALFCRKYPDLHATILDLQPGLQAGRLTAKQMDLEERMSFVCADLVKDDFPTLFSTTFDVALYFHIAHLLQPEVNQAVLAKVIRLLRPGGMLVFLDQVTDQTHGSRLGTLLVQFMALTMRTIGGTCYPFSTVKAWLEQLGMVQVKHHSLFTPGATLITAIKGQAERA
jgi:SAM-dependent methyltransferase